MSIERFLAVNLMMDLPLLALAARALHALRWRNLLAAAALAQIYGVLAAMFPHPLRALPCQLIGLAPVALVLVGRNRPGEAMLLLILEGLFTAGFAGALELVSAPPALLACPLLMLLLGARRRLRERWEAELLLTYQNHSARIVALIDTGNQLCEPLSGLPVLIVEERLLEGLLPASGYRAVAYGGVGGGGVLRCFRPEGIWLEGRRMPDAWVALSPVPLPGAFRAIAPCAYAMQP